MKKGFKQRYMRAKSTNSIITDPDYMQSCFEQKKVDVEASAKAKEMLEKIEELKKIAKKLRGGNGLTPVCTSAFSLVKVALDLAEQCVDAAEWYDLKHSYDKVVKAATKIYNDLGL